MGHVHPPRALLYRLPNVSTHWGAIRARLGLYRLPNVSTHWGAIRARLGPERWLEAAAHVVHRACSAERAELVAAPRRVRMCVYVCESCASVCGGARGAGGVHVLAGPLRHTSRFDSLHMCGVHRWSSVVVLRVSTIVSLVSRALVARGGALSHRYQNFSTAHARRDSRAHPHAARPAAPGRALRAGQRPEWHGRRHRHTHTPRHRAHKSAAKETLTCLYDSHRPLRGAPGARARIFDLGGNTP